MTGRARIPGLEAKSEAGLSAVITRLEKRLALIERKPAARQTQTRDFFARENETVTIEAPARGLNATLIKASKFNKGARCTFIQLTAAPVTFRAVGGLVNGKQSIKSNAPGTYDAVSDGQTGWSLAQNITEVGVVGADGTPGTIGPPGPTGADGPLGIIPDQRTLGNDSGVDAIPVPITIHQKLDWLPGAGTRWVFDGVDDRADFGAINGFEYTDSFSMGVWTAVLPAVGAAHDMFVKFSGTRGYSFYVSSANKVGVFMTTGGLNTLQVETTAAIDGAPHQLVATYDGSGTAAGVTIYVDSVSVALTTIDSPITATMLNAANFAVGGRDVGGASMFAGVLFETATWSARLTAAQVLETYAGGVPPDLNALATAPDPVFWAKFDDLDVVGANGIINYGTGAQPGTAEGGLTPAESGIGGIPVRATSTWGLLNPGATDLPVLSNGTTAIPSYRQLPQTATGALTGDVTKAAGSATTAIASNVIVDADVNSAAAIAQTKLGATTGFSVKASGSAATTSAEPIVTFSASANMSAERVTTASTSITINTAVASQIAFERAALTGHVTAPANSNATTIAAAVITPTMLAVVAGNDGVPFEKRIAFSATGATGVDVDVAIWSANAPFALRIQRAELRVSTAAATAAALRTAAAGGGAVVLPDATAATQTFATATTGLKRDNAVATETVALNGTVVLRVDRAVAGEVVLVCVRT